MPGAVSFLHPGLALAGLAAGVIPLLIHLLNRRRHRRVPWAAMDFLLAAAQRRSRRMRRQIARRVRRKHQLRELLAGAGLLPSEVEGRAELLGINPYPLRARALDHPLTLREVGRVLIHLNQRRGFLSNRKTDKARAKETKGMLAEISRLAEAIRTNGCRTLGEYLAGLDRTLDHATTPETQRVRHRHTRRGMYKEEFEQIWNAQRRHHPAVLTDELKERVRRIVFFQRDMYWPKSMVGRCELEPKLKRCPRGGRAAQRFRILLVPEQA